MRPRRALSHDGRMDAPDPAGVFAALAAAFPPRSHPGLVGIRRCYDEAVLVFNWPPNERLFGVPVSLTRVDRWVNADAPAANLDEWLDSVDLWLMEDVENGFLYRARRRPIDDYIELRGPEWPVDHRFYVDVVEPRDERGWLRVPLVQRHGLHPEEAVKRRRTGRLVGWVLAYENISNGVPYVGQASVVWDSPRTAVLDHLEVIPGLPATVMLDLVRSATHTAADAGAVTVLSQLDAEGPIAELLRIAGFHRSSQGRMEVDTDFLDEHPDAAEHLHRAALENSGPWGSSRRGRELG